MGFKIKEVNDTITLHKATLDIFKDAIDSIEKLKKTDNYIVTCIDTETTGLDSKHDKLIDVGIVRLLVDPTKTKILGVIDTYQSFNDISGKIPDDIVKLTGITNDIIKDQHIDKTKVKTMLKESDYILAHNATFDRNFLRDNGMDDSNNIWLCTFKLIDWLSDFSIASGKSELLSHYFGFYVGAHRAIADTIALANLLNQEVDNTTILRSVFKPIESDFYIVKAVGSPYMTKDKLKARGYNWDGNEKVWKKLIYKMDEELDWLQENIYAPKKGNPVINKVSLNKLF